MNQYVDHLRMYMQAAEQNYAFVNIVRLVYVHQYKSMVHLDT